MQSSFITLSGRIPWSLMVVAVLHCFQYKHCLAEPNSTKVLQVNGNEVNEMNERFTEDGVLSMKCSVDPSGGEEDLAWFKDGEEIPKSEGAEKGKPSHFSFDGCRYLMISKLAESDSGTYVCKDKNNPDLKITRKVTVLAKIEFTSPAKYEVIEGEGTTPISCSVKKDEGVDLMLRTTNNHALPASYFADDNSSLNTFRLIKPDRNSEFNKIKCIAQKLLTDFNDYVNEELSIEIDVQYKPEFEESDPIFYGIEGQNATIVCAVKAANPKPSSLKFKLEDGTEIVDNTEKYEIVTDPDNMKATLQIKSLTEDDFSQDNDQYECQATNKVEIPGVTKTFTIQKLLKPDAPVISLKESTDDTFEFEIKDPKNTGGDGVKIIKYTIEWKLKSENDTEIEAKDIKKLDNLEIYKLDGMEPDKEYEFTFFAHNPAGKGEPIVFFGKTKTAQANAASTILASTPSIFSQSANVISCSIVMLLKWML